MDGRINASDLIVAEFLTTGFRFQVAWHATRHLKHLFKKLNPSGNDGKAVPALQSIFAVTYAQNAPFREPHVKFVFSPSTAGRSSTRTAELITVPDSQQLTQFYLVP